MNCLRKITVFTTVLAIWQASSSLMLAQDVQDNAASWRAVIEAELQYHPKAQVVDIYKLVYQGVFGVGHMINDRESAAAVLKAEISALNPSPVDFNVITPCNPEGTQYRLHLRQFIANNGDQEQLVDAMIHSAAKHGHDTTRFINQWGQTGEILNSIAPELVREYHSFTERAREAGYPPVHHSDVYRKEYAPAYRVLTREAIERYFPSMLQSGED